MPQNDPETWECSGTVLVTAGVLLMLLPIAAVLIGIPKAEPELTPIGGEQLFDPIEALFASFLLGGASLLAGIAELQKSPLRFSLRTLLIATTVIALVFGLIGLAIK